MDRIKQEHRTRWTDKHNKIDRQIDRLTGKQTDRQTDRKKEKTKKQIGNQRNREARDRQAN